MNSFPINTHTLVFSTEGELQVLESQKGRQAIKVYPLDRPAPLFIQITQNIFHISEALGSENEWSVERYNIERFDELYIEGGKLFGHRERHESPPEPGYFNARIEYSFADYQVGIRCFQEEGEWFAEVSTPNLSMHIVNHSTQAPSYTFTSPFWADPGHEDSEEHEPMGAKRPQPFDSYLPPIRDDGSEGMEIMMYAPPGMRGLGQMGTTGIKPLILSFINTLGPENVVLFFAPPSQVDTLKIWLEKNAPLCNTDVFPVSPRLAHAWTRDICIPVRRRQCEASSSPIRATGFSRNVKRDASDPRYTLWRSLNAHHPYPTYADKFPFNLEGGNMLTGDNLVIVGKNSSIDEPSLRTEFAVKEALLLGTREPMETDTLAAFDYPIPYSLLTPQNRYQPFVHIDLFATYIRKDAGKHLILIGEARWLKGAPSNDRIAKAYAKISQALDEIANSFDAEKYQIVRIPLPLVTIQIAGHTIHSYWLSYNNVVMVNHVPLKGDSSDSAEDAGLEANRVWLPYFFRKSLPERFGSYLKQLDAIDQECYQVYQGLGFSTIHQVPVLLSTARERAGLRCLTSILSRDLVKE